MNKTSTPTQATPPFPTEEAREVEWVRDLWDLTGRVLGKQADRSVARRLARAHRAMSTKALAEFLRECAEGRVPIQVDDTRSKRIWKIIGGRLAEHLEETPEDTWDPLIDAGAMAGQDKVLVRHYGPLLENETVHRRLSRLEERARNPDEAPTLRAAAPGFGFPAAQYVVARALPESEVRALARTLDPTRDTPLWAGAIQNQDLPLEDREAMVLRALQDPVAEAAHRTYVPQDNRLARKRKARFFLGGLREFMKDQAPSLEGAQGPMIIEELLKRRGTKVPAETASIAFAHPNFDPDHRLWSRGTEVAFEGRGEIFAAYLENPNVDRATVAEDIRNQNPYVQDRKSLVRKFLTPDAQDGSDPFAPPYDPKEALERGEDEAKRTALRPPATAEALHGMLDVLADDLQAGRKLEEVSGETLHESFMTHPSVNREHALRLLSPPFPRSLWTFVASEPRFRLDPEVRARLLQSTNQRVLYILGRDYLEEDFSRILKRLGERGGYNKIVHLLEHPNCPPSSSLDADLLARVLNQADPQTRERALAVLDKVDVGGGEPETRDTKRALGP